MRKYERADAALHAGGGYAAEAEARQIAASLNIEDRVLDQPLGTLSGGQRRRVELARILFSGAETLLLDEPTNHLDADSIVWLREFLRTHKGGLVVISHDVALLEACVNKVLHLDANRAEVDVYNMGWTAYLEQRETDERRRRRERANAERKASHADGPGQQDAGQGDQGPGRAVDDEARRAADGRASRTSVAADRVAQIAFPEAGAVRQDAADGRGAVEVLRLARGLHRRRPGDRPGQPRRRPRAQRRGQDHAAAHPRRRRRSRTPARSSPATASSSATTRRSTRPSTPRRTVLENLRTRGARS